MNTVARVPRCSAWILAAAALVAATATPVLAQTCVVPDNGGGTVDLPPAGCGYVSPSDLHKMIDGLPPGTEVHVGAQHFEFFNVTRTPGGSLGGEREHFSSSLQLSMNGTGVLAGYHRNLLIQVQSIVDTGPRTPGAPTQSFDNDMYGLQGQLPAGDPDFDLLRITAGTSFGLPSPGHTTLTQQGPSWAVDSFFDITYRIDFIGHSPGPFGGMSGSTTGTIRMATNICPPVPPGSDTFPSTAKLVVQKCDPNLTGCVPIGDPVVLRASDALPVPIPAQVIRGPHDTSTGTIPVELVSMNLTGNHPLIGPFTIQTAGPSNPSTGTLENVTQDSATCALDNADSKFGVCARMTVGGETWSNVDPLSGICDPLELQAHITSLPPKDAKYENPFVKYVILYDQLTGQPRARVCYELHHADPPFPPPGTDCFPTTVLNGQLDFFNPPFTGTLIAQGPSRVRRDPETLAGTVPIELTQMDLTGNAGPLGTVHVAITPTPPSAGQVSSQPSSGTYPADAFFDVFFNVQTSLPAPNNLLHNAAPTHVAATVGDLPPAPGSSFITQPSAITQLLNTVNQPVGQIRNIQHQIGPPRDWTPPPPKDDYCFESEVIYKLKVFATGCEETLTLPGNFRVLRASALDTNGDGRPDRARSLMVWKLLSSHSQCLSVDVTGGLTPTGTSLGQIDALTPDEFFPANSFFDVFTEIRTPTATFTPSGPIRMNTTINNLPPDNGEIYYGPGSIIPIRDQNNVVIGQISDIRHIIRRRILPCGFDCLPHLIFRSKTVLHGADSAGGGALHDVVKGSSLTQLRSSGGLSMGTVTCLQNDGNGLVTETSIPSPSGAGFVYLSRDGFDDFVGTYNTNSPKQMANYNTLAGSTCAP